MDKVVYNRAPAEDVLRFQQQRIITALFRGQLELFEELAQEHDIALDKLVRALPTEQQKLVELADYLTPERAEILRKRILDRGNDAWRELNRVIDNFNIQDKHG